MGKSPWSQLELLLGSCKEVSIFGFEGGTQWYFDKVRNSGIDGPLGKKVHGWARERRQWPKTQVLGVGAGAGAGARGGARMRRRELLEAVDEHVGVVNENEEKVGVNGTWAGPEGGEVGVVGGGGGGGGGRRRLTGLPTTHVIKVERECMNNFVRAGIVKKPKA